MAETELTEGGLGRARWRVWGTSVTLLVTRPDALEPAVGLLEEELAATGAASDRFSDDSELSALNRAAGTPVRVGPVLFDDLASALAAAALTEGAVDPTVGRALLDLGYDRDFDELRRRGPSEEAARSRPAPGWRSVRLDPDRSTALLASGTLVDLGSLAKARCADRAAERISIETGSGTLVDLGGDLRTAGAPPPGGWQVAVVEDARAEVAEPDCVVSVFSGALASSSTAARTWRRAGRTLHHVIDPATGWPAEAVWRMVTVAAETCALANAISTASIVWGEEALFRVAQLGLAARFVRARGPVIEVGDWPRAAARPALAGSFGR